jgi:hypothetical protein
MWCGFRQNNSGGDFVIDEHRGIGPNVWIEADSVDEANEIAMGLGIYFDGVEDGEDCPCCGDRWYEAWEEHEAPIIHPQYNFEWHHAIYLHHKDLLRRVTKTDLESIKMTVDIPDRQKLFCFLADGSETLVRVWDYKHTLFGEVIPNYLMGPE